ncbi:YpdA family putative bacillithiol disulfide reductase [Pontibacter diazotrophicus]|uniref:YpdA family putative bacillithiol disulfide reductase n=1 Tax=Pontibacter diazotrophicus TaxID=1400979 RepID=A0A3D8LFS2_9BACT|nr:YpdA family putative bacillithiol disulfide reductase [Pontibacter diazotrophicus]RDV16265.1 YpdA family putative bacillithiol disulfide reductase [Pontibacter diazotrophicus]
MDTSTLDILIIGAGPIGLACGLEAQKAGLSYLIIEKGTLVNSLYNYPLNMTFFSTSEKLEIGGIPFVSVHPKPNRMEAMEYYRRVADSQNLNVHLFEGVEHMESEGEAYRIRTSKGEYVARHVIIAVGFYGIPNMLNIPGEELPKVRHYYLDPHYYYRQKVVVVGANNSSADAALETWRKGAEVTMVVRQPELGRIKYWTKPDLENRIKEGSIKCYFSSSLTEIREREVDIQTPEGKVTIENDFVLAMTGYQPDFSFLQKIGVKLSEDEKRYPQYDTESMETNLPNVYLAGVICGGMDTHVWFIENSREHAIKIVKHIAREQDVEKA